MLFYWSTTSQAAAVLVGDGGGVGSTAVVSKFVHAYAYQRMPITYVLLMDIVWNCCLCLWLLICKKGRNRMTESSWGIVWNCCLCFSSGIWYLCSETIRTEMEPACRIAVEGRKAVRRTGAGSCGNWYQIMPERVLVWTVIRCRWTILDSVPKIMVEIWNQIIVYFRNNYRQTSL